MKEAIDFAAYRPWWMAHMAPVADELERRGHPITQAEGQDRLTDQPGKVTVVASHSDMQRALKAHRRVVLMEHGAGQSYSNRNVSHPGGTGRQKVALCLFPNDESADRHRKFYPKGPPAVVVGSPMVDFLTERFGRVPPHPTLPIVAVSWHFASSVSLEAGSAWPQLGEPVLSALCDMRDLGWIELLGHAHPKMMSTVAPFYEARAIPLAHDFTEVCDRADLFLIDNSSCLFEFAALDRPVIAMDSPQYRPNRHHGLRFWWAADVGLRIQRADQVANAVITALRDPVEVACQRHEIIERVYPHLGEAAKRAADAIEAMMRS